jgi:hypothetical protein
LQVNRLNNAVEIRRPCRLTVSMSLLARKKMLPCPCSFGIAVQLPHGRTPSIMALREKTHGRWTRSQGSETTVEGAPENFESAGYSNLNRQPCPPFGSPAGQDPTPVLCAHALSKTVLTFLLELGRLLICK